MSTYKPGRLYLIDLDGETHEARYFANGINPPYFLTREGHMTHRDNAANVRLAVVLDREDEDVKALVRYVSHEPEVREIAFWTRVGDMIAAQITPPEPPREEPTEWGSVVQTDRGRAILLAPDDFDPLAWFVEGYGWAHWKHLKNPRPYENPREKPATAPQSDEQGSGSGIGRVSESEAVEGALDVAEDWDDERGLL